MYEDDTPPAERRAQALSLDRDLLRELLGQEELRDLLDADALEEVEAQLRGNPRNADQLHDQLRLRGDLREGEYDEGFAQTLLRERRALLVRFAGEQRLIAAEDAGRYRDAVGVMPPGGLPEVFLEGGPNRSNSSSRVTRADAGRSRPRRRTNASAATSSRLLQQLERQEKLLRGELRPGGTEREWCDPDVLRRLRRASLAALRKEVEPAEQAAFGRFLPHWHGIDRRATLREALVPLQGLSLPVRCGSPRCCRAAFRASIPASSTSSVRRAKSCGWERASTVSPSSSARTHRRSAVPPRRRGPKARSTTRSASARTQRGVLVRPRRRDRARARGRTACALGSRLGGRGDERRLDAAARRPPLSTRGEQRGRPRRFSRQRFAGITATRDAGR